ncbi:hypothetical protein H4217_000139 [Coemansia sp. RSA 1939]|nr:hypothetical protein H4217_000139 [Coemansia sp. RSA 1939]KAJ2617962.1 hypothetical protein EV177_000272 [Coemansia sp. RSA 1804]KAJ2693217.1 hypothetical protein GGH99_001275 [Coemansia sp. RSA 1285]
MVVASPMSFGKARGLWELIRSPSFTQELSRTLTAWGVLFGVGIWMVICQQWSDMRWLRAMQRQGALGAAPWPAAALLEDVVLDQLPLMQSAWVSDKLVGSSVVVSIAGCCAMSAGWRERLMMIRRIGWMVAVLYFLRSLTISVTTVPPSIASCAIVAPQSAWHVILATPQILAGSIGQCTDKIFSGHTAILTVSFLFLRRYATHWAVVAYSATHMTLGILSVLLVRYHYTIDVVIGLLLTLAVHHAYYAALGSAIRSRRHSILLAHQRCCPPLLRRDSGSHLRFGGQTPDDPEAHKPISVYDPSSAGSHMQGMHGSSHSAADGPSSPQSMLPHLLTPAPSDRPHTLGYEIHSAHTHSSAHADANADVIEMQPLYGGGLLAPADSSAELFGYRAESYLDVLGVNRPSGSLLPAVVAWMDGLDLRYA